MPRSASLELDGAMHDVDDIPSRRDTPAAMISSLHVHLVLQDQCMLQPSFLVFDTDLRLGDY